MIIKQLRHIVKLIILNSNIIDLNLSQKIYLKIINIYTNLS